MVVEKVRNDSIPKNSLPILSVEELDELKKSYRKKSKKLGKQEGQPYWQPVKGIVRWEFRQHYRGPNKEGKIVRKTRVLRSQKRKPRGTILRPQDDRGMRNE